ncbi:MAG: hypothetical protein Q9187_000328 [Circinaria calcarea]
MLHCHESPSFSASRARNLHLLLSHRPVIHSVINQRNRYGETALYIGVAGCHTCSRFDQPPRTRSCMQEMVRKLVELGADIDSPDHQGRTPLHNAIAGKSMAMADLLLTLGANIHSRDKEGYTLLHQAVLSGVVSLAERLLFGVNVNSYDRGGWTPVRQAAYSGSAEMTELLLSHGADPAVRDENYYCLDFCTACFPRVRDVLRRYLQEKPILSSPSIVRRSSQRGMLFAGIPLQLDEDSAPLHRTTGVLAD